VRADADLGQQAGVVTARHQQQVTKCTGRTFTATTALAAVLAAIEAVESALTSGVPLAEKLSWTAKEQAAIAVLADTASPADTALLAGEASITGETVAELAGRIVAAAEAYRFAASRMAGIRRAAEKAIAVAENGEALMQAVALAEAQCEAILGAANGV
jgi:hypothetical protein